MYVRVKLPTIWIVFFMYTIMLGQGLYGRIKKKIEKGFLSAFVYRLWEAKAAIITKFSKEKYGITMFAGSASI